MHGEILVFLTEGSTTGGYIEERRVDRKGLAKETISFGMILDHSLGEAGTRSSSAQQQPTIFGSPAVG